MAEAAATIRPLPQEYPMTALAPTRRAALAALLAAPALSPGRARAQGWAPSQPVRVIIPFTPGGTMDPVVRIV